MKRKCCYLIARTSENVICFARYDSECFDSWLDFLKKFKPPKYVVCDGQNGLLKAINKAWTKTLVQQCQFHIIMNGRQKLTKHPKTIQGKQLRKLSLRISNIHSPSSATRWENDLKKFIESNLDYLLTKSSKNEEEWYTHKRVKSYAFQLLKVYSSGNLFRCVYENNLKLANTNNFLEGGINSPMRRLLSQHRGMKYEHQMQLVKLYLFNRSKPYNLVKLGEHFGT